MNILISNDDGYKASGIRILANRLAKEHNVYVVAPMSERSGSSHSVNFFSGITYKKIGSVDGVQTYAVSGTPADCVMFAIKHLFKDVKFDLVVSGINTMMNAGSDIIFSGTFGAAQEGTFQRIPSIAVSVTARDTDEYDYTADFVARNIDLLKSFARENVTINVNVPHTKKCDIKGIKIAPVGFHPYNEQYVMHMNDDGQEVYIVDGHPLKHTNEIEGGDCYWLQEGYIAITPVQMICTDYPTLHDMEKATFEL